MTYQEFQQQYQEQVKYIWEHMSTDNTGSVFMHKDNQTIKYENLRYINKNGQSYIHDSSTGRLYDQMFNYYQDGRYYNPWGQLVQDVEDPNIIDGTFRDITDEPVKETADNIVDSPQKPRKYKPVRGPKLKEKAVQETAETTALAVVDNTPQLPTKMVTKEIGDAGQEAIEKVANSIPSGGGGKYVALALGALAIGYAAGSDKKKKEPVKTQRSFNAQTRMSYDAPITDPQAMQMAQAMSQYRYGSRLPGFN